MLCSGNRGGFVPSHTDAAPQNLLSRGVPGGDNLCLCGHSRDPFGPDPESPVVPRRWLSRPGGPVPLSHPAALIPGLRFPGAPVPTHPGGRAAPGAAAGAGRSGGPCPPAAAPREPAPSAGGGSGRKPTPFGGGSAAEEMPLAALGPGRRGRGGGEDGPPLPRRRRASVSLQRRAGLRLRRGQGEGTGTRARSPQGRTGLELMSGGLDTGVLVGCTPPNYSRAAGSDRDGELPHSGHGEGAAPDIQPPWSQPAPWHSRMAQAGGCPMDAQAGGQWKAPSTAACLACTHPWPGHSWGCPDTPTWQVGLGSGDPLAQGGRGEGVTGKEVTAEHGRRGTRDPLVHSCPNPPHTSAGRIGSPHTAISRAGIGGGRRSPGLGSIHGSRAWGQNGNMPGKSATPVPSRQDVPGDVCDRGEQQPCPTTEHCHLLGTAGTVFTRAWGPGPGTGSSGFLAPLSPR